MSQREILFKAKRTDNGEWVEGWYCKETFGRWPVKPCIIPWENAENGYLEHVMVDGNTVCQYTGLNDKNGKKIFEGDVCKLDGIEEFDNPFYTVIWAGLDCCFMVEEQATGAKESLDSFFAERCKSIRNIHDN